MKQNAIPAFDKSIQKSQDWVSFLMDELHWSSEQKAYLGLRAVLHALRDRMTIEEVAHLGAQMPMLLRGLFFEGWKPTGKPIKERKKEQFLSHIRQYFQDEAPEVPEQVTRAVFHDLEAHITDGEVKDVKSMLPKELRAMWH